jgi:hypothetical protein
MRPITKVIYDYIAACPNVTSNEVVAGLQDQVDTFRMKGASIISIISLMAKAELLRSSKAKPGAARFSIDRVYDEEVIKAYRQNVYKKRINRNARVAKLKEQENRAILESIPTIVDVEFGVIRHTFMLRPGMSVQFALPIDLTTDEANRLANCIKILPFVPKYK